MSKIDLPINQIICGDNVETMRTWPSNSVHCCVTSPPYWGLRDYGHAGQIGLEDTPEAYVARMVDVFREVRRVLRDDGTLWLNLGDSYAANGPGGDRKKGLREAQFGKGNAYGNQVEAEAKARAANAHRKCPVGLKVKDLVGIPWRVAFALQADGWWLRQDIIWSKPNPMPESVTDRCTKAHEYVFLLTKSERYYYDAEAVKETSVDPESHRGRNKRNDDKFVGQRFADTRGGFSNIAAGTTYPNRNRRSVWTITTKPYSGAHFAVMPPDLVEPCIKAGTSEEGCCPACGTPWERVVERGGQMPCDADAGDDLAALRKSNNDADRRRQLSGAKQAAWKAENPDKFLGWRPACTCGGSPVPCVVFDPFMGSGTVAMVARNLSCRYVGCELNPEYIEISKKRLEQGVLF